MSDRCSPLSDVSFDKSEVVRLGTAPRVSFLYPRVNPYQAGVYRVKCLNCNTLVFLDTLGMGFLGKSGGSKAHSHTLANAYALVTGEGNSFHQQKRTGVTSWTETVVKNTFGEAGGSGGNTTATNLGGSTDNGSSLQPHNTASFVIKT